MLHKASGNLSHKISIIAAAATFAAGFTTTSSSKDYAAAVQYKGMASDFCQRSETWSSYEYTVVREPA